MATTYRYRVMTKRGQGPDGTWHFITGSEGNRSYALGWYHALTSMYPRPAYALVRYKQTPKNLEWIEESAPARAPSVCM
jgi:hypothetical protein